MLEEAMGNSSTLEGDLVFKLWDTYGFPMEMTQEIAAERNITVDMAGFEKEMEAQKKRARSHAQFDGDHARVRLYEELGVGNTNFTGYETLDGKSVVVGLISMGLSVAEVSQGQELEMILQETPFYAEGGGQVGFLVKSSPILDLAKLRQQIGPLKLIRLQRFSRPVFHSR
jgi:alanyl-tRNA synthetase